MEKISIGEAIAWIGLSILVIWIILKLFGIIQTPLIFEMTPIITLALIVGGFLADMKNVRRDVKDIKLEIRSIGGGLVRLGQDFNQLKGEHDIIKIKRH